MLVLYSRSSNLHPHFQNVANTPTLLAYSISFLTIIRPVKMNYNVLGDHSILKLLELFIIYINTLAEIDTF